jgi:TPR repeat protein
MPNLIALAAGAGATALTLILGLAFWPPMATAPISGKSVVSQPVFVAGLTHGKPDSGTMPIVAVAASNASAPQPAVAPVADASAMAKLAVALQTNPTPIATQGVGTTRSMILSAPGGGASPASEAARRLCAQGLVAMAAGDIAGARLFLERAAESGDARALMVLGESYDPATLARMGAMGIKGDAAKARDYYTRALAAGMGAARERMAALEAP